MSFSKRSFLAASLATLAACGFSPVYAPGGAGDGLRHAILVQEPDNRNEFSFVSQLEKRLGRAQSAPYALNYTIRTRTKGVGITPAQETTRYNLFGIAKYEVIDRATGKSVSSGMVENFTGYSATSLIVGTQSVTRDANERLMVVLADQVVTRLIATSTDWRQ
ncbi:MAG: LPS assembly lipoprotein LptE [Rhodobacter sp.]|nr:LPS assembly lipoprotein LptE [Rhodobacter sp.]